MLQARPSTQPTYNPRDLKQQTGPGQKLCEKTHINIFPGKSYQVKWGLSAHNICLWWFFHPPNSKATWRGKAQGGFDSVTLRASYYPPPRLRLGDSLQGTNQSRRGDSCFPTSCWGISVTVVPAGKAAQWAVGNPAESWNAQRITSSDRQPCRGGCNTGPESHQHRGANQWIQGWRQLGLQWWHSGGVHSPEEYGSGKR